MQKYVEEILDGLISKVGKDGEGQVRLRSGSDI